MKNDFPNTRPLAKWVRHGSIHVQDPDVKMRLDRYLAERFAYRSRTQWADMIAAGSIRVNGAVCRPSRRIGFGDRIEYQPLRLPEPDVAVDIRIIHEDEHLLVVNKPPNLPVHPSGRYFRNTMLCILLASRGETLDEPGVRIVHRLDRETSGVLIFGKSRDGTARLSAQFEERRTVKEYLVLVHGSPAGDRFRINAALGPHPNSRVRKAVGVVPQEEGRRAVTDFAVAGRGPEHSLLLARPRTGRLHQIRVHCRHAGFPVVGDKLYGLDEAYFLKLAAGEPFTEEERAALILDRQALHAWRLTVEHPGTGAQVSFDAPLPEDISEACRNLGVPLTIPAEPPPEMPPPVERRRRRR